LRFIFSFFVSQREALQEHKGFDVDQENGDSNGTSRSAMLLKVFPNCVTFIGTAMYT
jgi:hypothetical protein